MNDAAHMIILWPAPLHSLTTFLFVPRLWVSIPSISFFFSFLILLCERAGSLLAGGISPKSFCMQGFTELLF